MHAFLIWAALMSGVWVLFAIADDHLPPKARAQVTRWLSLQGPRGHGLATFVTVCDSLFGTPTVSGGGLLRVGAVAQGVIILLLGLASVLYPGTSVLMAVLLTLYAPIVIGALAVMNLLPSYLVLLAGRAVLHWTSRTPTLGRLVVGLVGHGVLTVAVATLACGLGFLVLVVCSRTHLLRGPVSWLIGYIEFVLTGGTSPASFLVDALRLQPIVVPGLVFPSFGLWFYTPCFPTVWLWLYALSGFVVKWAMAWEAGRHYGRALGLEKTLQPLHALGAVAVVLVSVGYWGLVWYAQ
jgi:hypothetical protein